MKWVEHTARMGQVRNTYKFLVGKPEGKRRHELRRCRWTYNITI